MDRVQLIQRIRELGNILHGHYPSDWVTDQMTDQELQNRVKTLTAEYDERGFECISL